jgi:two-component sensor histidine kinase
LGIFILSYRVLNDCELQLDGSTVSMFECFLMTAMLKALNDSSIDGRFRRKLMPLCIGLGLWVGLVGLFAVQAVVVNSDSWSSSLVRACSFWLLWLFFLPVVVWLSLRFPLEQPKVFLQIGIHLAACALIIAVTQVAYRTFMPLPQPPPENRPPPDASQAPPKEMGSPGMLAAPYILIYLMAMSACVAFAHFRKSQERERRAIELEARLAQARLQALRMQINPHFLFNTLNAISSLVHTNPRIADDMIADLSELFRVSLESSDNQEIPLSRELELLRCYLAIEQRRFGERLQIEQDVDPKILDALVPTLILQPIAENAIRHGIEPQAAVGKIAIRVLRDDNRIKISVSDNGKKPVDFSLTENESGRRGVGLANTQARLQQLYGKEQSFSIGQGELGGWTVEITLPFRPPRPIIP